MPSEGVECYWQGIDHTEVWLVRWNKTEFLPSPVVSILPYGCTTWKLTKRLEKKKTWWDLHKILRVVLHKSWKQYPTKQKFYGHLPSIWKKKQKNISVRRARHAGHCWKSKKEFIADTLLRIPERGRASNSRPVKDNLY